MNREQIQARIAELESNKETLKSNFMTIDGAIQDCNYWLSTLDAQVEETKPSE